MEQQKASDSSYGSTLPALLTITINQIREMNGLQTQGIFRLPGNNDNIKALEIQVNCGTSFTTDRVSPITFPPIGDVNLTKRPDITVHDVASLLKMWLRGLAEPLIPDALYQECITAPDSAKNAMQVCFYIVTTLSQKHTHTRAYRFTHNCQS
jgi:hypothetical protein